MGQEDFYQIKTVGGKAGIDLFGLEVSVLRQVVFLVKSGEAKKHVFGSSVGCRVGGCQTLACALGVLVNVLILLY
jgi:hypothetical protein